MRPKNIPALTTIRFFAAVWVVMFHINSNRPPLLVSNIFANGYIAVSLFFVLSGFILSYTYISSEPNLDARRFWVARFARIYPVYLLGVIICVPTLLSQRGQYGWEINGSLVASPTLLQAWYPGLSVINQPGWSVSVEAFFYFLFPFVGIWFYRKCRKHPFLCLSVAWFLALVPPTLYLMIRPDEVATVSPASELPWLEVLRFNPLLRLPGFLMGIGTAAEFAKRKTFSFASSGGLAALALTTTVVSFHPSKLYVFLHNDLLAPLFGFLIFCLASENWLSRVLSVRMLVYLGEASYSLYIIHVPVLRGSRWLTLNYLPQWNYGFRITLIELTATLIAAVICHEIVEKPARRFILGLQVRQQSRAARRSTQES